MIFEFIIIRKLNEIKFDNKPIFNKIFFIIFLLEVNLLIYFIYQLNNTNKINYDKNKIVIISEHCPVCGLFSLYNKYLKCAVNIIKEGFIPLIDLTTKSNKNNIFKFSQLDINPWELYFDQPFKITLNDVEKRKIKRIKCRHFYDANFKDIYDNEILRDYWSSMANKYLPIKNKIIKEAEIIKYKLFKNSDNILGILMRGTDFKSMKPKYHNIPPNNKMVSHDIKKLNMKNKYDYFFLTTEDYDIRQYFIIKFGVKLKYYTNKNIKYNYTTKIPLALNDDIKGNIEYMKTYLINIIILSKCLDIICARTNGAIGAFIFSSGFRNKKVYDLGKYK